MSNIIISFDMYVKCISYMNSMNKNVSSFSYNATQSPSLLPVGWTVFKYLFKLMRV